MRIIELGAFPSEREWKAHCTNCRTRFECLEDEGWVEHDPREGSYLRVSCPVCNRTCFGSPK